MKCVTGAEVLLNTPSLLKKLAQKKVAYLGNQASIDSLGNSILQRLLKKKQIQLSCLFSPQHGFYSTKQANMIASPDDFHKGLKVYSLYSRKTRRLSKKMKQSFDILLFDLQDTGCRIYTYLSTLLYLLEDCADKTLVVLDRPNPLGRFIEGNILNPHFKSFVGAACLPMSYGLTLGEVAFWYKHTKNLKVNLQVVWMKNYQPGVWNCDAPWVLPSPNMPGLLSVRCYPGTVLLEGTTISEGRGTTKPFEYVGHPAMDTKKVKQFMQNKASFFMQGCFLRDIQFEPVFDKWKKKVCYGFQIHLEKSLAKKGIFRPYRLISLFLKAFKNIHPDVPWKLAPPYEYEYKQDPIDIINGSQDLKHWIEGNRFSAKAWDELLLDEEHKWKRQIKDFLVYV